MFGLVDEYVPTLNRNNDDMAGVEEIVCEPTDNLVVNDNIDLGKEHFFKLDYGDYKIDYTIFIITITGSQN